MTQIDSNPQSTEAQQYFKSLEEIERTNKNKQPSHILIRNFKRNDGNGNMTEKVMVGPDG